MQRAMPTPPKKFDPFDINSAVPMPLYDPPPLHHERYLSVVVVGAGPSGLLLAYKLLRTFRNVNLKILEKNADVGGVWLESNYPGFVAETPSHNYTYSFEPKLDFKDVYSSRQDVLQYFSDFATNHSIRKYCKFKTRVTMARWMEESGKWFVSASRTDSGEILHFNCDVLVNAGGYLGELSIPKIPGLRSFKGLILHTAMMDNTVDLEGKKVGVVGNGSTAAQLIPAIQPVVEKLVNIVHQPVFVASQTPEPRPFRPEERHNFTECPGVLLEHRRSIERYMNSQYESFISGSWAQFHLRSLVIGEMRARLDDNLDLADMVIPEYDYGAGPVVLSDTYLEALNKPNVTFKVAKITSAIAEGVFCRVRYLASQSTPKASHCTPAASESTPAASQDTPTTSEAANDNNPNEFFDLDVLIFATGPSTLFRPPFPIETPAGDLRDLWREEPQSYLGVGVPHFPNYLSFLGPNSLVANGASLLPVIEAQADYICHWLNRWQTESILHFSPKPEAVADFTAHKNKFMASMVWSNKNVCSWYRGNKLDPDYPVTALWPGSILHYLETTRKPRHDDWDVVYKGNRFEYLGSGHSQTEADLTADWSYYIREHDLSMGFGGCGTSVRWDREKLSRSGTCRNGGLNGYVWNGYAEDQTTAKNENGEDEEHRDDEDKTPVPKRLRTVNEGDEESGSQMGEIVIGKHLSEGDMQDASPVRSRKHFSVGEIVIRKRFSSGDMEISSPVSSKKHFSSPASDGKRFSVGDVEGVSPVSETDLRKRSWLIVGKDGGFGLEG